MRSSQRAHWVFGALVLALVGLSPTLERAAAQGPSPRTSSSESVGIDLEIGQQHVLPAQGVRSYSEGVPGIVDIRLTGDSTRFVMVGRARGTTTLLLLMADGSERHYTIRVGNPLAESNLPPPADPLKVDAQASIRLDLYFVQVDRKRSMDVGMTIPSTLGNGQFSATYNISAASLVSKAVVGATFMPALDMAQSQGWAKVARHMAVITTNGAEAQFDSGGEFNAVQNTSFGATVVSIRYGTVLSIAPRYDKQSGRIELRVAAEVSDLAATGAPIPGRTKSRVETVSNLALGESLAVAGLVATNKERSRGGLPFLSQIPILGLLFGKQADKEQEVENVVFIAPSVVEPLKHPRGKELMTEAIRSFETFKGDIDKAHVFPGKPWKYPEDKGAAR